MGDQVVRNRSAQDAAFGFFAPGEQMARASEFDVPPGTPKAAHIHPDHVGSTQRDAAEVGRRDLPAVAVARDHERPRGLVRKSRALEYAHHLYYERLGHISVYTHESDQSHTPREARQREFFETARTYLERGVNLIIAPEGTSRATEESPGDFRPGAFRLALSLAKEPLIVPVAVANFDRRLNHTALGLVVKRPFRVSERVKDPEDPLAMRRFLVRLQKRYRAYVREAAAAADTCWERSAEPDLAMQAVPELRELVAGVDHEPQERPDLAIARR